MAPLRRQVGKANFVMRSVIRNTMISSSALVAAGTLNLLLVPILISAYGLADYGVIVLMRLLLPSVALGLLDLGLPVVMTRNVAYHLTRGDSGKIAEVVSSGLLLAFSIGGGVLLVVIALETHTFAALFRIEVAQQEGFRNIFLALAAALPVLFAGTVLEGAIDGWEKFWITRGAQVVVNIAYFGIVMAMVLEDWSFHFVALAFIFLQVCKALAFAVVVVTLVGPHRLNLLRPRLAGLRRLLPDMKILYATKLVGIVNNEIPALLVASFVGPTGLGLFDALIRIPRFLRMLLGAVNATIVPVAVRFSLSDNTNAMRSLILVGTRISAFCIMPLAFNGIVYSDRLLVLWLGAPFGAFGTLLSLAMVWVLFLSLLGIVTMASVAQLSVLRVINWVTAGEAAIKVGLLVALLPWLGTKAAFIVLASLAAASYLAQLQFVLPRIGIDRAAWQWTIGKIALGSALPALVIATLASALPEMPALWSLLVMALSTLASYGGVYSVWSSGEREAFYKIVMTVVSILRLRGQTPCGTAR